MEGKMRPPSQNMGMDRDSRDMRPPVTPPQQYMNRDDSRGGRKDDRYRGDRDRDNRGRDYSGRDRERDYSSGYGGSNR